MNKNVSVIVTYFTRCDRKDSELKLRVPRCHLSSVIKCDTLSKLFNSWALT